jgi:hypothetical protein
MDITSKVLLNPEIETSRIPETYIDEIVKTCKKYIIDYCNLHAFPEYSKGYLISGEDAAEDVSGLSNDSFRISINGSGLTVITLDLSSCDTGENTAAEIEENIQMVDGVYGFSEVEVTFDSTSSQYTITSGRYGDNSTINIQTIDNSDSNRELIRYLKLSPEYGAKSFSGAFDDDDIIYACIQMSIQKAKEVGVEGLKSGSIPGGVNFTKWDGIDPFIHKMLRARRRI